MTAENATNGKARPPTPQVSGAMPGNDAPRLEWALWLAGRGLPVHPLHWPTRTATKPEDARCSCGKTDCGKRTGKHPRVAGWQSKATTDERQIRTWWTEWPEANIGIYTGGGAFFVVDEDGDAGRLSREELEAKHAALPPTFVVATGQGAHRYLGKPAGMPKITNKVAVANGLDIRADGGNGANAVGPGSLHWSGARYRVLASATITAAPKWLLDFVPREGANETSKDDGAASIPTTEDDRLRIIPMETRARRATAYLAKAEPAVSGAGGHNVAMRVATAIVRGFALDAEAARHVLTPWNARCRPPWTEKELDHKIPEAIGQGRMAWGAKLLAGDGERFVFHTADEIAQPQALEPLLLPHFWVRPGRPTILGGIGGVGKTVLAQELALIVSEGEATCWGVVGVDRVGRVIHIDYELGTDVVEERYRRLARGMGTDLSNLGKSLSVCSMPPLYLSTHAATVEAALYDAWFGATLAIIDNLRAACPHATSENDSAMRLYVDLLTRVSLETGCVILIIAHEGKPNVENGGRSPQHRLRGSSAIFDAANTVLSVTARKGVLEIAQTKSALGAPGTPVLVRFKDVGEVDPITRQSSGLLVEAVEELDAETREAESVERAKLEILRVLTEARVPPSVRKLAGRLEEKGGWPRRASSREGEHDRQAERDLQGAPDSDRTGGAGVAREGAAASPRRRRLSGESEAALRRLRERLGRPQGHGRGDQERGGA